MRAVIQRVEEASVSVEGEVVGSIARGLLVLVAVHVEDDDGDLEFMVRKIPNLRVFEDQDGRMNRSVAEVGGAVLLVSQFTLYGDCRKGNRPSFTRSAPPDKARELLDRLARSLRDLGLPVRTGRFQAMMDVSLLNQGPVTLLLDSRREPL